MGCSLPKLRKAEEKRSPGNIYSTLRRPQVETKVGVAYTYHFLDFLLGKEEVPVSSVLCLSSVRELPVQVRELYAQGFVLVALHPFVHPCGPRHAHIQRQLHRAVLVRETPSSEKSQLRWSRHRLETDVCVAGHQTADPEVIQSYVKRIQDVAEQGVMFVGFLQQPGGGPCFLGQWDPEELSSLHSSPSPIHRHPFSAGTSPTDQTQPDQSGLGRSPPERRDSTEKQFNLLNQRERRGSNSDGRLSSPELERNHEKKSSSLRADRRSRETTHNNNNHICLKSSEKDKNATSPPAQGRMQLFALYNHTGELNTSLRFYSLRVPLQVQKEAGLTTEVDAHWLDYMTQHFTSGARLIDGFFHLGDANDNGVSSVDSVFIFQSAAEEIANASYDAIVVEQWTIVDGVVVKTDYIPLLQSLAPYGWRLMCVLPTPIVKTNSDGSLSTKQILFLQRPVLQRKRKDFKMLNLRGRSKAKKSSVGEEERETRSPVTEAEMYRLRRNTKEEEAEARKRGDSGRSESASPREEDTGHQKGSEKSVRRTDGCQRDDGGVREEAKAEERIKQQLFSGVC
ncbi:putative raftlin [Scophthalmus maximus]|uniref:Putative raftlin n=1 Tax=Scophthalmus maximus TaxID=52904 RepID=A0A2U9CYY2_SCOMX|nr:putative raftlin [Scophthalmus maximus]